MPKAFLNYLLSLCILLLSGYSFLYAHANKGSLYIASSGNNQRTVQTAVGTVHQDLSLQVAYSSPSAEKTPFDKYVAETEIEETESLLKKNQATGPFLATVFYAQVLAFLLFFLKKNLTYCKDFFSFSPLRFYLLFRVFRI